jgi:hypothetical protein
MLGQIYFGVRENRQLNQLGLVRDPNIGVHHVQGVLTWIIGSWRVAGVTHGTFTGVPGILDAAGHRFFVLDLDDILTIIGRYSRPEILSGEIIKQSFLFWHAAYGN